MSLDNITVNGKKLSDIFKPLSRRVPSARTSKGDAIYSADQKAKKIRVCGRGHIFIWLEKAPYVPSGFSVLGALELTEDESEVKCHECGEWHSGLSAHIRKHKISAKDYRLKHGLPVSISVNSKSNIAKNIKKVNNLRHIPKECRVYHRKKERAVPASYWGRPAIANLYSSCEAQSLQKLRDYAFQLGHTPTIPELAMYRDNNGRATLEYGRLMHVFRVPMASIMLRAGLKPRNAGRPYA